MLLAGVLAPVPTPFNTKNQVDHRALTAALTRWAATALAGFVVLGSSGEAALLDDEEADGVLDTARQAIPEDRLFIAGTGRESTTASVRAAIRAAALGADALLVRTPGFYKSQMTTDAFVRHYTEVADASPVPVVLYNFTAVTGVTIGVDAVARLAEHPNIVGMKESGGDVGRMGQLVAAVPPTFPILAGSGSSFYPSRLAGAAGGILALACVAPNACVRLDSLVNDRRQDEARDLQERLLPLARLLGSLGVPGLKQALAAVGFPAGIPRPPLAPVSASDCDALAQALASLKDEPL